MEGIKKITHLGLHKCPS